MLKPMVSGHVLLGIIKWPMFVGGHFCRLAPTRWDPALNTQGGRQGYHLVRSFWFHHNLSLEYVWFGMTFLDLPITKRTQVLAQQHVDSPGLSETLTSSGTRARSCTQTQTKFCQSRKSERLPFKTPNSGFVMIWVFLWVRSNTRILKNPQKNDQLIYELIPSHLGHTTIFASNWDPMHFHRPAGPLRGPQPTDPQFHGLWSRNCTCIDPTNLKIMSWFHYVSLQNDPTNLMYGPNDTKWLSHSSSATTGDSFSVKEHVVSHQAA